MSNQNKIYGNSKIRKNAYKYNMRGIQEFNQSQVATDIKNNNNKHKLRYTFDNEIFQKGTEWFDSGLLLEDATEEMRENPSFVAGFRKGQRIQYVNRQLYDLGREYYLKGYDLENTPEKYKNNDYFVTGYNDTKNNNKHR